MSIRPMKWHIFGPENHPLCWDDRAFEFDSEHDAREFLRSAIDESLWDDEFWIEAEIREAILYYDGGYLNATNIRMSRDYHTGEEILVNKDGTCYVE